MNMEKDFFKQCCYDLLWLTVGCILYAVSTVWIKDVNIIPGSCLGIAVAVNKVTGFPSGTLNLLLNIPIMVVVTRKLGKKTLFYTLYILAFSGVLIDLLTGVLPMLIFKNPYILSVIGGGIMGIGAGILLAAKGTMAGTTALAVILQKRIKKFSYGMLLTSMDVCIVLFGSIILKDFRAVPYSVLYTISCNFMIDRVFINNKAEYPYPL